ncbi:ClC family H(+)/Cl(-) exchange transporter [Clostridium perfringens]|uniref:ClC family H(+)/Cl(-) exchange transporter n=1 Tax=Clostridium perfringens TaxID=1502 RepID=UPI0019112385|nr:ClC family H(+)/Cl(-) exchange transporter [Clostridium perfringens]QQA10943.1 ClC family H(+)/Cl(-) exchange transporter [Clostridium perfringens]
MSNESTKKVLSHRKDLRFKLVLEGAAIGLLCSLVLVLNRIIVNYLFPLFKKLYAWAALSITNMIIVLVILAILGALVGFMVRREPMISGSGIPQVEGELIGKLKMNWLKILIYKFLGGVISLGAGLSLGREGPSVQMGAAVGEGFSNGLKRINIEKKYLITSGASAGLAAAFNAPLSGVIFALEEVHKSFSPLVLVSAMAASLVSDFVSKQFLGMNPSLGIENVPVLPLKYYLVLIILGVILGIGGAIFSKGILKVQSLYGKFKKVPVEVKVMIPFLLTGILGIFAPIILGGGHELIMDLATKNFPIKLLLAVLLVKFLLTIISFGAGTPGGIFFPLLLLGAVVGNIVGIVSCNAFGVPNQYIIDFIILAMAGNFASIVKAPITGIILITEMTGSFEHMLALSVVVIISYVTSDLLKSEPIYESLLERWIEKVGSEVEEPSNNKTLLEVGVELGSEAEGKEIKDVNWPETALLVAIKRGNNEIIPKGSIEIQSGDYLVVMVDESRASSVLEEIQFLTSAKEEI